MTPPPFVLELSTFVAVRNENVGDCIASNKLPLGYPNGSKNYTGLRETPLAALERAKIFDDGPVTKHTYVLLNICFTPAGIAYYTLENAGQAHNFASVLSKMTYYKGEPIDWGVWHFLTDVPLHLEADDGTLLVHSEWEAIVELTDPSETTPAARKRKLDDMTELTAERTQRIGPGGA